VRILCFFTIVLALIVPLRDATAAAEDVSLLLSRGDAAWEKRGTDGTVENGNAANLFRSAAKTAPYNYEAHWKAARCLWWMADQDLLANDDRNRQRDLSSGAMDLAARAILIRPDGVEGRLYWALSALHYCYGVGMVDALKEGIQDEAARHLLYCYERDRTAEGGIVMLGLSSLYRTAPWPLRDSGKAVDYAREALSARPGDIRAAVFLGVAVGAAGRYDESLEILTVASEMDGDTVLEPDCRWWKRFARTCIERGNIPDPDKLL
jgi:tetratricopeptide (TPR) repeat protein